MTEMARKSTKFLAFAAGAAVLAAAAVMATTGPAPRAEVSAAPAPEAAPWAVVHAVAHPPSPPDPPEAPDAPRARRPWLGVVMSGENAEITSVAEGSPAAEAGLKKGDRIVQINDHHVENAGDVVEEIRSMDPGDTVKLRVERDGDERTLTATLAGRRGPAPGARGYRFAAPAPFAWHEGDGSGSVFMVGPSRNFLGVEVHPMSAELREYFKAPRDAGLLVNRVVEDSPAEKAGLKAGDVIVSVDGNEIGRVGDISRALNDREAGDTVDVKVLRDGSERTLKVELEERESPRMRHRSFVFPRGDGDDEEVIIGVPREAQEELHRAIEESMRTLHESLESIPRVLDDDQKIQLKIREQLRDELNRVREEARVEARKSARRARYARNVFDI